MRLTRGAAAAVASHLLLLGWHGETLFPKFVSKAAHKLRGKLGDVHSGGNHELAAENGARAVVVGQLAVDPAILTFLIPAETPIGNSLGADELETAKKGVPFRHEKGLAKDGDLDEMLVRPENAFQNARSHRFPPREFRLV
jgi:hypothetical protein